MDAIPGRLNQLEFEINKQGMFRGQCSEFCGVGHGFMPIVIQSCNILDYWCFLAAKSSFLKLQEFNITYNNSLLNLGNIYSSF